MNRDVIYDLAARLTASRHTVFLTGSGVSAESGIATFRDARSGLWSRYRPEDLATPAAFRRNPALVWDWYQWRRESVARAQPNPGHRAIAEFERRLARVTLITQNVDGLHQRAGSSRVVEFHGNIMRSRCSLEQCGAVVEPAPVDTTSPPPCPRCGAWLRPDVVWFGEAIPSAALEMALAAVEDCDVILSIGTSSQVQPAAGLAAQASARGAFLVEVNPESTPITRRADCVLPGPSGRILPALVEAMNAVAGNGD